jgi:hypothetical protein
VYVGDGPLSELVTAFVMYLPLWLDSNTRGGLICVAVMLECGWLLVVNDVCGEEQENVQSRSTLRHIYQVPGLQADGKYAMLSAYKKSSEIFSVSMTTI